jgi:hypothetical protein
MSTSTLTYIHPRWLTMIPGWGECCVCSTPYGYTHLHYLNLKHNWDDKYGFLVCGKDECNLFIKQYMQKLYYNVYTTNKWRQILNIYANNLFITVERSNGDSDNDWILDNDSDCNSNTKPLALSFIYAILCSRAQHDLHDSTDLSICPRLPNELWEYIYDICLDTYKEYINLTFSPSNKQANTLNTCIRVKKGDIYKKITF